MQVIEKFISINGEGLKQGELAVFIRFMGCNLRCSYCDTKYSFENPKYTDESIDEIVKYCENSKISNITLTGGEPLLHERGIILWSPCHALAELDTLLGAQGDDEPVAVVVILDSGHVHFAVFFQTFHHNHEGIYAMNEVGGQIQPLPHDHRVQTVILHGTKIGVTSLHVQAVLIGHVIVQQPVGRAVRTLGIA